MSIEQMRLELSLIPNTGEN